MATYYDMRNQIVDFLDESKISAYDLVRIGRDLCCCRTCGFFIQHFTKDGKQIDYGHCNRTNQLKAVKPNAQSCGYWRLEEECGK